MTSIGAFPAFKGLADPNPYQALFYRALEQEGISWWGECDPWKCRRTGRWPEFVHLHWPELLWKDRPPEPVRRFRRLPGGWRAYEALKPAIDYVQMQRLMATLEKVKARGRKIIWTLHNVRPHEGAARSDQVGYARLARLADLCIAHSSATIEEFATLYGRPAQIVVMPHGNYEGIYPVARPRTVVLRELGLSPDKPTACCIGNMRAYKGIDLAIEAVRRLEGRVQLVIAGQIWAGFDVQDLAHRASETEGVLLLPGFVDNQLFSDITNASDVTLLPYRHVTGSGVLLASLTLGTGVVASDLAFFREILEGHEGAGRLAPVEDAAALAAAVEEYLSMPAEDRRRAVTALSERFAWRRVVRPVVEAIRLQAAS